MQELEFATINVALYGLLESLGYIKKKESVSYCVISENESSPVTLNEMVTKSQETILQFQEFK